ncbi:uncharacterized protein [Paramisgurnus dabryanus]
MQNTKRTKRGRKQVVDEAGTSLSVPPPVSVPLQVAPTAVATIENLKEENKLLKEERDFLREQLKCALENRQPRQKEKMQNDASSESESGESSTFSDTSDSSDKHPKRKQKRKHKVREEKHATIRRVQTPDDVLQRYKAILKSFMKTRSVSHSCKQHNVDRNTIALTAIIAELQIIATPELHIPEFQGGTLQKYAKECKEYMDTNPEVFNKINEMKRKRELLPIRYKFRKEDN